MPGADDDHIELVLIGGHPLSIPPTTGRRHGANGGDRTKLQQAARQTSSKPFVRRRIATYGCFRNRANDRKSTGRLVPPSSAISASVRPKTGTNLNPCPESPAATKTFGRAG